MRLSVRREFKFSALALGIVLNAIFAVGCSTKVNRFDVIQTSGSTTAHQITRAEVADSGSGQVSLHGGHSMSRVTLGGYYLRRVGVTSTAHKMNAGLFGNPLATQ